MDKTLVEKDAKQSGKGIQSHALDGKISLDMTGSTRAEIVMKDQPIELTINTPPDYAAIAASVLAALAGIVTTIFVAWISRANQNSQSRATLVGVRSQWQQELRSSCSGFCSQVLFLRYSVDKKTDYEATSSLVVKVFQLKSTIEFLLDPNAEKRSDDYKMKHVNQLRSALNELFDASVIEPEKSEAAVFMSKLGSFQEAAHLVIEDAWQDIRRDAYGKSELTAWAWFKNLFKCTS